MVLSPACNAVTVQLPVLDRVTVAEDWPGLVVVFRVEAPAEQGPLALKLTSCIFAEPFVWAVAVTVIVVGCVGP